MLSRVVLTLMLIPNVFCYHSHWKCSGAYAGPLCLAVSGGLALLGIVWGVLGRLGSWGPGPVHS